MPFEMMHYTVPQDLSWTYHYLVPESGPASLSHVAGISARVMYIRGMTYLISPVYISGSRPLICLRFYFLSITISPASLATGILFVI